MNSFLPLLLSGVLLLPLQAQELNLQAPNYEFDYVDQKNGIGNSCGPASLLNAFGSGEAKWQQAYLQIPGKTDRDRIGSVIKSWGLAPSGNFPQRKRWQIKGGVNFADLATMAEEMRKLSWVLPQTKSELFFGAPGKDSNRQLKEAHKRLQKSLKKGLPPILSLRRFVLRNSQWQSVHGHFVVLMAMSDRVDGETPFFTIEFVDPIGAKTYRGTISAANGDAQLPCLVLNCPTSTIGSSLARSNEVSALGFSGAIGAW